MSVRETENDEAHRYPKGAIAPKPDRPIKIIVENGAHGFINMGDVAMLQVAVSRIAKLWPEASIDVVTEVPELLARYCPAARPVSAQGQKILFQDGAVFGGFYRLVPGPASDRVMDFEREMRVRWPSLARATIQFRKKLRRRGRGGHNYVDNYVDVLLASDLVIISGCGGINDVFPQFAMTHLDVLAMSYRRGVRTAMFGQGFGPLRDPKIWTRAKEVLPLVDVICTREGRAGVPLLHSLGVPPSRVMTTGDDAIELAYEARAREPGTGIGVNLRMANYSEVDSEILSEIRPVLHTAARKHGAALIPIPIARHRSESDATSIRQLLAGYDDASDGGVNLDSPLKVIKQTGCCRVVVAGSTMRGFLPCHRGYPWSD